MTLEVVEAFEREFAPQFVECSHAVAHAALHVRHPRTGRLVCVRCHPPAEFIQRSGG